VVRQGELSSRVSAPFPSPSVRCGETDSLLRSAQTLPFFFLAECYIGAPFLPSRSLSFFPFFFFVERICCPRRRSEALQNQASFLPTLDGKNFGSPRLSPLPPTRVFLRFWTRSLLTWRSLPHPVPYSRIFFVISERTIDLFSPFFTGQEDFPVDWAAPPGRVEPFLHT